MNVVQLLVHSRAKVNVQNIDGSTPLHVAIKCQQFEVVMCLLNAGADVGLTDAWRSTPLHYLTPHQLTYDEHQERVVKQTIKCPHLLIRNALGMTALSYLTSHETVDCVNKKQKNSNVSSAAHETDLPSERHTYPITAFSSSVISCLLKSQQITSFSKTKVYCRNELVLKDCYGNTPLHHAVRTYEWYKHTKMHRFNTDATKTVNFLVQRGADINAQNNEGLTPLHVADGIAAFKACLRHANDQSFTITDKRGRNFWHLMFLLQDEINLLTRIASQTLGSDAKYSTDDLNRTPLHYACMKRWSMLTEGGLIEEFVQKFSDEHINKQDRFGRTALHYAAMANNNALRLMYLLRKEGADDTIRDNFEMTADKYTHVCRDYKTKVYDLTGKNILRSVMKDVDSISCCMQLCISDRSHNVKSYKARLRKHICELRACTTKSYMLSTYSQCRFDYSQSQSAALKQDTSKQVELLPTTDTQPTTMFSAIQNQVQGAMQYLATEISDEDKRFACEVVPVGSAREGTKIGCCDKFDFDFVLTYLSTRCKVCYSPESPPGFVLLKATTPEYDEDLFNSNGILNTRIVKFKFEALVKQILSSLSFCEATGLEFRDSVEDLFPASGTKPTKPNIQIKLKFTKPVNGCHVLHTISAVDIVPALRINDWWPEDTRREDLCKIGECLIVFTQPQNNHPWIGWTEPHGFVSFAPAESRLLQDCPHVIKAAFMVVKWLSKYFCVHKLFSSHVIKMAVFWCLDDDKNSHSEWSSSKQSVDVNEDELLRWVQNILRRLLCFAAQDYVPSYFMPKCHQPVWLMEEYLKQFHMHLNRQGILTYTDIFSVNDWLSEEIKSLFIYSHLMSWSVLSDDDELKLFVPSTTNPLIEKDVCTTLLLAD